MRSSGVHKAQGQEGEGLAIPPTGLHVVWGVVPELCAWGCETHGISLIGWRQTSSKTHCPSSYSSCRQMMTTWQVRKRYSVLSTCEGGVQC